MLIKIRMIILISIIASLQLIAASSDSINFSTTIAETCSVSFSIPASTVDIVSGAAIYSANKVYLEHNIPGGGAHLTSTYTNGSQLRNSAGGTPAGGGGGGGGR